MTDLRRRKIGHFVCNLIIINVYILAMRFLFQFVISHGQKIKFAIKRSQENKFVERQARISAVQSPWAGISLAPQMGMLLMSIGSINAEMLP